MAQRVLTGGRARLFLNGQKLGFAMGVDVDEQITQERIRTLDNLRTTEFATTDYAVRVSMQIYRIPNADLVAAGLWPQQGRTPDEMKQLFLNFENLQADLYDSHTNAYVGKVSGMAPTARRISITARGVVMSAVTFEAIAFGDEGSPNF